MHEDIELTNLIPKLDHSAHKGRMGRIGVVGGCAQYAGAPFFTAEASLRSGAEIVYVFTNSEAVNTIKSYAPDIIVTTPYSNVINYLPRLDIVVIGPGLGRDWEVANILRPILESCLLNRVPVVLDADALFFIPLYVDILKCNALNFVITPNQAEFERMCVSFQVPSEIRHLSSFLPNVMIVLKGVNDMISLGSSCFQCGECGIPRRVSGQGDLLCGILSVCVFWFSRYQAFGSVLYASLACQILKLAAKRAYSIQGIGTTASDILIQIPSTMGELSDTKLSIS